MRRLMKNWMNDDPWAMGSWNPVSAPVYSGDWSSLEVTLTPRPTLPNVRFGSKAEVEARQVLSGNGRRLVRQRHRLP